MKSESPDLQNTTKYYAVPCCDVQIVGSEDVSEVKGTIVQYKSGLDQCFSTFVRPRSGNFFFHKMRAQSQHIYS